MPDPTVSSPKTFPRARKGDWPERSLAEARIQLIMEREGISEQDLKKKMSEALGDPGGALVYRLFSGDTRSINEGYSIQPSPEVARDIALFLGLEATSLIPSVAPPRRVVVNRRARTRRVTRKPAPTLQQPLPLEEQDLLQPEDTQDPSPQTSKEPTQGTQVLGVNISELEDGIDPLAQKSLTFKTPRWINLSLEQLGSEGARIKVGLPQWWQDQFSVRRVPLWVHEDLKGCRILLPTIDRQSREVVLSTQRANVVIPLAGELSELLAMDKRDELLSDWEAFKSQASAKEAEALATIQGQFTRLRDQSTCLTRISASMGALEVTMRDLSKDMRSDAPKNPYTAKVAKITETFESMRDALRRSVETIEGILPPPEK